MMFMMHISMLFALSVLLASTVLIIWSLRAEGEGRTFAKVIGSIVFIFSLLSMLCIGFYGVRVSAQGGFDMPSGVSRQMHDEMMEKMMPMMMEKMTNQMGKMGMSAGDNQKAPSQ